MSSHGPSADMLGTKNSQPGVLDIPNNPSRPALKRQATAPLPLSSIAYRKKKCDAAAIPRDDNCLWSEEVHSAFLEALQKHPPIPTWRPDCLCEDTSDDEQADYYRIIQNYILKKTGQPHSFEQISERINFILSSPAASPLIRTPTELEHDSDKDLVLPRIDLHSGEPYKVSESVENHDSLYTRSVLPSNKYFNDAPSMSRRRKACNRPTLNMHVDIPPISAPLPNDLAAPLEDTLRPSSALTPSTASIHICLPDDGLNPSTPVEQCYKAPSVPPQISRAVGARRVKPGRWAPTPTEGVLPSPFCISAAPSPLSTSSNESSGESSSGSSTRTATERTQSRPKMSSRATSWLSVSESKSGTSDASESPGSSALDDFGASSRGQGAVTLSDEDKLD